MVFKKGHIPKNKFLFYPVPSLCYCGCKEITWMGNKYINGHGSIGIKRSEEYKQKQKESHKNQKSSFKGRHHSEEFKENLSKLRKGKKYPKLSLAKKGKKLSEKHKKAILNSCKKGIFHYNWQGGKSFEPYCPNFNKIKKEEIRNKYNRKCYICGKDEKDNLTKNRKNMEIICSSH